MNQHKTGKYIAEKRKLQNMTQAQLADRLGVSDKAVSKWERGISLPDVSKYQELCNVLEVSLNELFAGEDLHEDRIAEQSELNLMEVLRVATSRRKQMLGVIAVAILCVCIIATGYIANLNLGEKENDNRLGQLKYGITTADERYTHYTSDGQPMIGVTVDDENNAHVSRKSYFNMESWTRIVVQEAPYSSYEEAVTEDSDYKYRSSHEVTSARGGSDSIYNGSQQLSVEAGSTKYSNGHGLPEIQLGDGVNRITCGILESGGAMAWIYTDCGTYTMTVRTMSLDDKHCKEELHFFLSEVSVDKFLEKEPYEFN